MTITVVASTTPASAHTGDPEDYRWVTPPSEFTESNEPPLDRHTALVAGIGPSTVWTGDLQAVVDLAALPDVDHPWATLVAVDPATLPTLPDDLEAVGNAYEVAITDGPEGPAPEDVNGSVRLSLPHVPTAGFVFAGGAWTEVDTEIVVEDDAVPVAVLPYVGPAVYVAATTHDGGGVPVVVVVVTPLLALAALVVLARRRQHPDSDGSAIDGEAVEPAATTLGR